MPHFDFQDGCNLADKTFIKNFLTVFTVILIRVFNYAWFILYLCEVKIKWDAI